MLIIPYWEMFKECFCNTEYCQCFEYPHWSDLAFMAINLLPLCLCLNCPQTHMYERSLSFDIFYMLIRTRQWGSSKLHITVILYCWRSQLNCFPYENKSNYKPTLCHPKGLIHLREINIWTEMRPSWRANLPRPGPGFVITLMVNTREIVVLIHLLVEDNLLR